MKRNARLYLPRPAVSAYLACVSAQAADAQPRRRRPSVSVEMLKGGCLLYRLSRPPHAGAAERRSA